jgi:6-phosphogluconolactonase (cycloisomerase 2 family)
MIEIKKSGLNQLNLRKSIITLEDVTLNQPAPYIRPWNNEKILFVIIQNDLNVNFNSFNITDDGGAYLINNAAVHQGCYSISFSGDGSSTPTNVSNVGNLGTLNIYWNFAGLSVGSITLTIYSIIN